MQPRIIRADQAVTDLRNKVALASGPVIFCLEEFDNADLQNIELDRNIPLEISYDETQLNGINIIKSRNDTPITAIPYFAAGNREQGKGYKVWLPEKTND